MKKLSVLFVLFCAIASFAQSNKENVAVYISGVEPAGAKGVHKILGAELARMVTASETYSAIDRTEEILKQIAKEHVYQRTGTVSDEQIKQLGKQLGVQYLCIAEVTEVGKTFYLEVKLVDVETAKVMKVASTDGDLKNAGEMVKTVQHVTRELIPQKVVAMEVDSAQYYSRKGSEYSLKLTLEESDNIIDDWNNAIAYYTHAIRIKPDAAEYYIDRGGLYQSGHFSYHFLDDCGDAIADYTRAIRLKPDNAEYYFIRGLIYDHNRTHDKAITDFESALRIDPDHVEAKKELESVQKDLQRYKDQISTYTKGISEYAERMRQKPNDAFNISMYAFNYRGRGTAYYNIGEYDKAISDFTSAIQLKPEDGDSYSWRGMAYTAKKDYPKAISDLEKAVQLDPSKSWSKENLEKAKNFQKYSRPRRQ